MKKSKILIAWLSLPALILAMFAFPLSVRGETTPLTDILPADVYGVVELNPTELHETIQEYYVMGIDYIAGNALVPYFADEDNAAEITTFYEDLYGSQATTIGMTSSIVSPAMFIVTEIERENFDALLDLYGDNIDYLFLNEEEASTDDESEEEGDIIKGWDYDEVITTTSEIYQPDTYSDTYLMYKDGYFFVSSEVGFLEEIDAGYSDTLTDNSEYQEVSDEFLSDSFLTAFVDTSTVIDDIGLSSMGVESGDTVLESFEALGFSISQTRKGVSVQEYVMSDEDVLESLGLDYSDNLAEPHLYEFMPSSDPILYLEGFNLGSTWDSVEGVSDETEAVSDFTEAFGVGLNDYILPLLTNSAALLIHNSEDFLPSLNVLIDADDQEDLVAEIIEIISGSAQDFANEDLTVDVSDQEMLGGDFTVITFDVSEEESQNPYAIETPEDWLTYTLYMGITEDDLFLISTNSNIEQEYGEDLIENDDFDMAFNENGGELTYLTYFNFGNIGSWIKDALSDWEDADEKGIANFDEAKNSITDFFSVFDDFHSVTVQTNDYTSTESDWNFDFDELSNVATYFENMQVAVTASLEAISNSSVDFEDVPEDEWYSEDVYYLATTGVVTGYDDDVYAPSNEITRAEFLTMLMRALAEDSYVESDYWCWSCDYFTDVDDYDWYTDYVNQAYELDLVSGYEDGTFRPNENITRAEAVTILNNALSMIGMDAEDVDISFNDVGAGDWYFDSVKAIYSYGIVEGVSTTAFEPNRNINRAESAKIIRLTLELL